MPGFQVGCLITHCQPIKDYMINRSSLFQQPASYMRQMLTVMINDRGKLMPLLLYSSFMPIYVEWLKNIYFPTNLKRLKEHLEMTTDWLKKNELPFIRPKGGLFVFVNFSKVSNDYIL